MTSPKPSQKQSIANSSFNNSNTQQTQAGRDALSFQNSRDNQIIINNVMSLLGARASEPQVDWEWATQILEEQEAEVWKRLKDTLVYQQAMMEIGLEEQPQQVNRSPLSAARMLFQEGKASESLNPEQLLIEVFGRRDIKRKLLILGTPGAGKTTALLGLAEQLLRGAIANPRTIIPVIFELSTWKNDNQSIRDWLVEQLYDNFGGDRKLKRYEQWLDQRVLLPLMDGLDELGLDRQKKCTVKLNQFAEHYPQVVVCCRVKEFETAGVRLGNLRGAVCLQPLSDEQIQAYLQAVNRLELWQQIQTMPEMQQMLTPTPEGEPGLLRVPLFVAIAAAVYNQQLFRTKAELLEAYIEQQLSYDKRQSDRRKENQQAKWAFATIEQEPQYQQTRAYLMWLAHQLQRQNEVDLLIEQMQPTCINSKQHKRLYQLLVKLLSGLIIGPLVGLLIIQPLSGQFIGPSTYLLFGPLIIWFIMGLCFGLLKDLNKVQIQPYQLLLSSSVKREFLRELKKSWMPQVLGLMFGIIFGLKAGLLVSLCMASASLSSSLNTGLKAETNVRLQPNQGIRNSFYSMWFLSFLAYPSAVVIVAMLLWTAWSLKMMHNHLQLVPIISIPTTIISGAISASLVPGIFLALLCGYIYSGGMTCTQHLCLRLVLTRAHATPWNYARFLNYCTERRLLQRIGGRYRFIHRELLDHFAGTPHQHLPDAKRDF